MNVARIAVLVVALGAAGTAGFLAMNLSAPPPPPVQVVEEPKLDTTEILVASRSIPLGGKLTSGSMTWQAWPKDSVSAAHITRSKSPDAENDFDNAIATTTFETGEPLTARDLARTSDGFMSAILPKGKRAISIKVESEYRAAGFILPNDRVDIILTRSVRSRRSGSDSVVSRTILENVRILAIDQTYEERGGEKFVTGDIATLELNPRESEVIALADQLGDLSLALRSVADIGEKDETEESVDERLFGSGRGGTRVIKYGMSDAQY